MENDRGQSTQTNRGYTDNLQNVSRTPPQPFQSHQQKAQSPSAHPIKMLIWGLVAIFVITPLFFLGTAWLFIPFNYELTAVGSDGVVSVKKDQWVGISSAKEQELKSCSVTKDGQPYSLDDAAGADSQKFAVFHADEEGDYTIACLTSQDEKVIPSVVDIGDKASIAPTHTLAKRIIVLGGTAIIFLGGIVLIIWGILARRQARKAAYPSVPPMP